MKVRFAIAPPGNLAGVDELARFVDAAEHLGFDTIWLSDVPLSPLVDPIVGLAFAAGRTSRIKLGANLVPFGRNPFLLAKSLAQLDVLAHGRVLLSLVRGLDQPGEAPALGIARAHRGRVLEEIVELLRAWWAGAAIDRDMAPLRFEALSSPARPSQNPLELWLGGSGPQALQRVGRVADGWLGSALTPAEAGIARRAIEHAAAQAGRRIDPEHFGMSLAFASRGYDERSLAQLRARRPDVPLADLAPSGFEELRRLVSRYVAEGISKFVLRPVGPIGSLEDELSRLAGGILDLQT